MRSATSVMENALNSQNLGKTGTPSLVWGLTPIIPPMVLIMWGQMHLLIRRLWTWTLSTMVECWCIMHTTSLVSTHALMYTHMHIHTYTRTHPHIHAHIHTHTSTHTCTHIHTSTHTYMHIHTRAHIHTHVHTYTHTCTPTYIHLPTPT